MILVFTSLLTHDHENEQTRPDTPENDDFYYRIQLDD